MLLVTYMVAFPIVLGGFRAIEGKDTAEHARRVVDVLDTEIEALVGATGDWSNWTDTYDFIETADPQFVRDNVETPTSFVQLRLNAMVFVHRSGRRVFTRVYDKDAKRFVAPPAELMTAAVKPPMRLDPSNSDDSRAGILMLPRGPMLVAVRHILTSEGTGPPRGTLLFGRYLDSAVIGQLSKQVRLNVTMRHVAAVDLPADFSRARAALLDDSTAFVDAHGTVASGYVLLADVYNKPALLMRVDVPRTIYARGRLTAGYFMIAVMGLGLLLGMVLFFIGERLILSQLARRASEQRYRAVVQQTSEGILILDEAGKHVIEANPAAKTLLELNGDLQARSFDDICPSLYDVVQETRAHAEVDALRVREVVHQRADAGDLDLEVSWDIVRGGGRRFIVCVVRDVTSRKAAERALRQSEERYALAAQGANDGLWDWDLIAQGAYFSPRWKSMLGYAEDEVGDSIDEWLGRVHSDDQGRVRQALLKHLKGESPFLECEFQVRHKNGSYRWMLARGLAVGADDGRGSTASRMAGSMTDITARKDAEAQLLHDALHDSLTGLPNRVLFADRLTQALLRTSRAPDRRFGVLFVDVDRFKLVNDSLGHLAGDQLLVQIAQRLVHSLRPADTVARLGGDEFAILVEEIGGIGDIDRIVNRIVEPTRAPHTLDGREVYVTVSIGSVLGAPPYARPDEVLRDADTALYRAKALGRDRHVPFDSAMHDHVVKTLRLESDLRRAVERQELVLYYQPIMTFSTGSIAGFEALLRWQHKEHGLLGPMSFIPIAEETGLIIPIGNYVLDRACAQMREWNARFPAAPPMFVTVNISPKQFSQPNLAEIVEEALSRHDLDPRALRLEITETAVMEDLHKAIAVISRLRNLGIGVAIDDFGTGHSSLSSLHALPIDTLKIDRSFLQDKSLPEGEVPKIIRTILAMAKGLNLSVVAEGIEDPNHATRLKALGCQFAQGYLFSKPVDASLAEDLLRKGRKPTSAGAA